MLKNIAISASFLLVFAGCAEASTATNPSNTSGVASSSKSLALTQGLNPHTELLSAEFFCYERRQPSFEKPVFGITVDGDSGYVLHDIGKFKVSFEAGPDDGQVTMVDQGNEKFFFEIAFSDYGQVLTPVNKEAKLEGCFQEGAAHEKALNRFTLNTPEPGVLSCEGTENSNAISIELLADNNYRVGDQTGRYESSSVLSGESSELLFATGPLQGTESRYKEDANSGQQVLQIRKSTSKAFYLTGSSTSSSSVTTECTRQSEPKPYKLYGPENAPPAIAPEVALSGAYFMDTSVLTALKREDGADYIDFRESGYVYLGLPLPGGTDCGSTRPNGLPLCEQYQFDGTNLSIVSPWGQVETLPISVTDMGVVKTVDDFQVEPLAPIKTASIVGTWESQEVDATNIGSCAVTGSCSSSITDRIYHFRDDGRYLFNYSRSSNSSFNAGFVTSFANSANRDEGTGSYQVDGNRLLLTKSSGELEELPVHITEKGRLAVGEFQYNRP